MSINSRSGANIRLTLKLFGVSVAMFAFGVFAMPPLYEKFCEIAGIGQAGIQVAQAAPLTTDNTRTVKVRLDATTNSALNWEFKPVERDVEVTVGTAATVEYFAINLETAPVAGRAVFNVSPPEAARFFVKTECFCFSRQELQAGERRKMPVYFYIKEDLPEGIEELTLAYTFFKMKDDET